MAEGKDRLAEVAELVGPIGEAFPRLVAVLPPNLSRSVMTSVGGGLSLEARLDVRPAVAAPFGGSPSAVQ
jgi:hypothetical protein